MDQNYQIIQKQKQIISGKQLQSLNILTMANVELNLFLQTEYLENPMLEQTDGTGRNDSYSATVLPSNEDIKWNRRTEETQDLKTYLKSQLKIVSEDRERVKVKEYLIECVEDTGYFTMPYEEAAQTCNVSSEYIRQCIEELRLLEPVGVFSGSLKECLLRQLEVLKIRDSDLETIIQEHLKDVAEGNISHISRSLHIPTAQVRKHILFISTLKPRPAMGFGDKNAEYIIPDIIVRREERKWEIILNDSWMGDYHINDYYLKLMSETEDTTLKKYFEGKAARARYILQSVEQRRKTLFVLMQTLLSWQEGFFNGQESLRPMTMTDVAERMGVSTSTISRAVKGKYVQFPRETRLLKELFSQGVSREPEQMDVNAQKIKELIRTWIGEEDKKKPYSDQKLREMLAEKEIYVSRRVVAKYRSELGIKGSFDRKE